METENKLEQNGEQHTDEKSLYPPETELLQLKDQLFDAHWEFRECVEFLIKYYDVLWKTYSDMLMRELGDDYMDIQEDSRSDTSSDFGQMPAEYVIDVFYKLYDKKKQEVCENKIKKWLEYEKDIEIASLRQHIAGLENELKEIKSVLRHYKEGV